MAIVLRPSDWVVPRRGTCTAFWCGVILVLISIILLVTSRHKGRLFQSWGSVFLGCGFCLLLISFIMCIHAYFVMSSANASRNQNSDKNHKMTSTCYSVINFNNVNNQAESELLLRTLQTSKPGMDCTTSNQLPPSNDSAFRQSNVDLSTAVATSQQTTQPDLMQSVMTSQNEPPDSRQRAVAARSPTPTSPVTSQCDDTRFQRDHPLASHSVAVSSRVERGADDDTMPQRQQTASNGSAANNATFYRSRQITSLPLHMYRNDVICQGNSSVTPSFAITVTPLTARRIMAATQNYSME